MKPPELERYLHEHIPLSRAMQVTAVEVEQDQVTLSAPLPPNINHRDTVFGGSAAALAVLAAWSLVHTRLLRAGLQSRLVIQRSTMQFAKPITGTFTARSFLADAARWERFVRTIEQRGKARIPISCTLSFAGEEVGQFEGEFVAFKGEKP